jgi:hypothetical protein
MEALSVQDAAQDVFRTFPGHTSTREDEVQPVGLAAMRRPTQQTHFTLSHLMGDFSWYASFGSNPLLEEQWPLQEGSVARAMREKT